MPTILLINGWRFYFYANEGEEPIHIHCKKGEKDCKFWLNLQDISISEDYSYNLNDADKRAVKKLIFQYFEYFEQEWKKFQEGRKK